MSRIISKWNSFDQLNDHENFLINFDLCLFFFFVVSLISIFPQPVSFSNAKRTVEFVMGLWLSRSPSHLLTNINYSLLWKLQRQLISFFYEHNKGKSRFPTRLGFSIDSKSHSLMNYDKLWWRKFGLCRSVNNKLRN